MADEKSEHGVAFDLLAKLHLSLETVGEQLRRQNDETERRRKQAAAMLPIDTPRAQSKAYPASGNLTLGLGHPEQGRYWEVRAMAIGGGLVTDAPAGKAYVMVAGAPPADLSMLNLRDQALAAFPTVAFYSARQLVVRPGEHLWVVITGGTPSSNYTATAICYDYPVEAFTEAVNVL